MRKILRDVVETINELVAKGCLFIDLFTDPVKWLDRIQRYLNRLKEQFQCIIRVEIWTEELVDQLYKLISLPTDG